MAAVLETHLDSLDLNDSASKPEHAAYETLTNDFRAVASSLQRIAGRMAGYRDLPMAAHDEARLSSAAARNSFAAFVDSERALLDLLRSSVERDEKMLTGVRKT